MPGGQQTEDDHRSGKRPRAGPPRRRARRAGAEGLEAPLAGPREPGANAAPSIKKDAPSAAGPAAQPSGKGDALTIGWFSSGGGEGSMGMLRETVRAIESGELNATIQFLFCNRDPGQRAATDKFLGFARKKGIPVVTLSSYKFKRESGDLPWERLREPYDEAVIAKLGGFEPKITVSAGYMLIAPLICQRYPMINEHPALPGQPAGMWQDVIWKLIEMGATETGAMIHVATPDVDLGPVLSYTRFPIVGGELDWMWFRARGQSIEELKQREGENFQLFKAIRELSLARERPLLIETLKAIASGQLSPPHAPPGGPLELTASVEAAVASAAASA